MVKVRLDQALAARGLTRTRSQAESYIRLGRVTVSGRIITKPGYFVSETTDIQLAADEQLVSRAGLKLLSVIDKFHLDFQDKVVLDVGSSTGGFTDLALRRGAKRVVAVDVGTDQLHPSLRSNPRIDLHEKTDIRSVFSQSLTGDTANDKVIIPDIPDLIVIDVSFISLRDILPHIATSLSGKKTQIIAMVKPQFETGSRVKNAGVVKNDTERRRILHDFEAWSRRHFVIRAKADSEVAGTHGNRERFYLLTTVAH